jgi:uncharacterized membrane protein YfcA
MNLLTTLAVEWLLLYAALGALVGFMAGLLGVGGGGILVPLLASLFAYQETGGDHPVHLALGTALACMIISSAASARAHHARGAVEWRVVTGMALGIVVGAFAASRLAAKLDAVNISLFFAFFMAVVALQMFFGWQPPPSKTPIKQQALFGIGMGIGAVSALAAVGGGFLTLIYLSYKNIEIKKAIGSSAAIAFPIALSGAAGYMAGGWSATTDVPYTLGYIYLPAFIAISIASMLAAPIGVRISHRLPAIYLKRIFALIALLLSIKMVFSAM